MKILVRLLKLIAVVLCLSHLSAFAQGAGRQPQCQREESAMRLLKNALLEERVPLGLKKMGPGTSYPLDDPLYSDGNWAKYEYDFIERELDAKKRTLTRYFIRIHYMFNLKTGYSEQFKLKNDLDQGCRGQMSYNVGTPTSQAENDAIGLAKLDNFGLSGVWVNTYVYDHYYQTLTFVDRSFVPDGSPVFFMEPPPIYYQQVAM